MLGSGRPGVLGSFRSPWGGTAAAGGVRARAPGGAHLATFAGAIFWLERWSGSQSACAVAGAGARARPGGGLPTLSEPVAEPSSLGRRHSRDNNDHIDVVLTNTLERRAAYPSTCAQLAGAGCAPGAGRPCPFCGGGVADLVLASPRRRGAWTACWWWVCDVHC